MLDLLEQLAIQRGEHETVPLPGTRVVVRYAAPVQVPAEADRDTMEACRAGLERTLARITEEADRGALA